MRRNALQHFREKHVRQMAVCQEPGCQQIFDTVPEALRHFVEQHGKRNSSVGGGRRAGGGGGVGSSLGDGGPDGLGGGGSGSAGRGGESGSGRDGERGIAGREGGAGGLSGASDGRSSRERERSRAGLSARGSFSSIPKSAIGSRYSTNSIKVEDRTRDGSRRKAVESSSHRDNPGLNCVAALPPTEYEASPGAHISIKVSPSVSSTGAVSSRTDLIAPYRFKLEPPFSATGAVSSRTEVAASPGAPIPIKLEPRLSSTAAVSSTIGMGAPIPTKVEPPFTSIGAVSSRRELEALPCAPIPIKMEPPFCSNGAALLDDDAQSLASTVCYGTEPGHFKTMNHKLSHELRSE